MQLILTDVYFKYEFFCIFQRNLGPCDEMMGGVGLLLSVNFPKAPCCCEFYIQPLDPCKNGTSTISMLCDVTHRSILSAQHIIFMFLGHRVSLMFYLSMKTS